MMLSDDDGDTWYLGGLLDKDDTHLTNEEQAVDLGNDTVLVNARGAGIYRLLTMSHDGGKTFGPVQEQRDLPQPLTGCEGSTIRQGNKLFYSGPSPHVGELIVLRYNMTVWQSDNQGQTWVPKLVVNPGPSGYSAMVPLHNGSVGLLFERWEEHLSFIPNHISFVALDL
eukprot:TRINITY_DN66525_c7_g5_i2.p1 TRINITY_DN66525_c7_g5~~TRINITY_DN66525_c7_g5_i2.p1  ORF type:complete len:169 (+),score=28.94 TRINITY_DN66525_c7_g5_i2:652-1158(+)